MRKVSPAVGSLQVENLSLKPHRIGRDNHRDVAMGYILLSMCCCCPFISQTRQSYNVPVEAGEREARAWEALAPARKRCEKKQRIHSFRSAASQTRTVHERSERTSALVQAENRLLFAVKHFQNKFSWSHDRLWQEQENRVEDPMIAAPAPTWLARLHSRLPSERADNGGPGADASSPVMARYH